MLVFHCTQFSERCVTQNECIRMQLRISGINKQYMNKVHIHVTCDMHMHMHKHMCMHR